MRFLCWILLCGTVSAASCPARFVEHTVATGLKGGYQVVAVDLNHDGKPDLIALSSGMTELVWFENPGWERHVIAAQSFRHDQSGGMGLRWRRHPRNRSGVGLFHGGEKERRHCFRAAPPGRSAAAVEYTGDRPPAYLAPPALGRYRRQRPEGAGQSAADRRAWSSTRKTTRTRRWCFYRPGEWKREQISDQDEGVVHCIYIVDWDGDGRDQILTASFVGIHLYKFGKDGRWSRTEITKGDPAPWPKSGSSDVAVGRLGKQRYLAAIEPWHGNQVAVYRENAGAWQRRVIDDSLRDGHTILTADLNGDGSDEVIAGYRGKGVNIYYAQDPQGERWSKQVLDDSISAAACAIVDLNGDGRPDIACIGSSTANLKWYENLGPQLK